MTDKQKQAISAVNDAKQNKALDDEQYYLLLEFIMGNQPTTQYACYTLTAGISFILLCIREIRKGRREGGEQGRQTQEGWTAKLPGEQGYRTSRRAGRTL